MAALPQKFAALEKFVDNWVLADSHSRAAKRRASDYADIQAFYDAMLPLAPDALKYLSQCKLGAMSAADECLLKLMLALAEIGPAVEWYPHPTVIDGFDAERFPLIDQLSDTAAQE